MLLRQVLYEIPKLEVSVDGQDIPDWFDHRSKGGSLSFWVGGKFPVIAVCSVYGGSDDAYILFEVCLSINGVQVYAHQDSFSVESRTSHVWLHDLRAHMSSQQWQSLDKYLEEDWKHVEVSFAMSIGTIKCCGVHVYKKETNMEDVQFKDPNAECAIVPYESDHDVTGEQDQGMFSSTEGEQIDNSTQSQLLNYFGIPKTTDKGKSIMVNNDEEAKLWDKGTSTGGKGYKDIAIQDKWTTEEDDNDKGDAKIIEQKTLIENGISLAYKINDRVRMRSKDKDTVKGALIYGAAIVAMGGRENILNQIFKMKQGEKLLKASQCFRYTTAAPIPGVLFISTEKVAFCSEDFADKLLIPIGDIRDATRRNYVMDPTKKFIDIVTKDKSRSSYIFIYIYKYSLINLGASYDMKPL
ncbi:GEM-like protein 4 [Quillaja saponaria]|uniref:GEM-like protein 4 n=1 Tax=Quillaja saponaria TaxID=32244 RepID=A0AAD7Q5V6_QUISA|nr:GEM-like protein 4 [Quillaja saponaria]